jgi:glutathione S-transferase
MIELYHFWSSVCSVRCRMALEEKGVKWASRYIDLFKFDQLKPDYLAINPDGMVPTLVHDGAPVRESTIINEYIDAAFAGPALVPAQPLKQARMREFIRKCEDDFDAIVKLTMVKYILPKLRNRWGDEELSSARRSGRCAIIRTFTLAPCAARSRRLNSARRASPSNNCSTASNARSIRDLGSSATR